MPQAIVDPHELRRFARNLKQFTSELQNQMGSLHGQMLNLGSTWHNQEHQKFADEFEQTMKTLTRFISASEQQIPFLLRKAERIEEYLQQH